MGCRKNVASLTVTERQKYTNAVQTLKDSGGYQVYIDIHAQAGAHGHGGPAFFAWHREFLRRYELDLQAIDATVSLPYWDWTVNNLNDAGTESLIWRDDMMGGPGDPGNGFAVTTGPFAGWGLRRNAFNIFNSPGGGGTIEGYLNRVPYWPKSTGFTATEWPHGGAHVWVGGDMGFVPTAVKDPCFFMLHCNVDRLWAEWMSRNEDDPVFEPYQPASGALTGHNLNDTMWPWNGGNDPVGFAPWTSSPEPVRPADLVDHTALGYTYDSIDGCTKSLKELLPKELKEKEFKDFKEFKEKETKEFKDKEFKEKEFKEFKEIREDFKGLREDPGHFIPAGLRPDLEDSALNLEKDVEIRRLSKRLGGRTRRARANKNLLDNR